MNDTPTAAPMHDDATQAWEDAWDALPDGMHAYTRARQAGINALGLARAARPDASDGYATAFYEIATMLGIGARAASPANVWRDEMRPKLEAMAGRPTAEAANVERLREALKPFVVLAAKVDAGSRRIVGVGLDGQLPANTLPVGGEAIRGECTITMGDLINARTALSSTPQGEARSETERLRVALRKIAWWGMPATGKFWDNADGSPSDRPMPYSAAYGSNGERDYVRSIAAAALFPAAASPTEVSRFDPPGLWESEPRSSGFVIKEAGER